MMILEPTAVLIDGCIIGDRNICTCRRQPRRQQPQVITQPTGKRWRRIVVCPMSQRQVMLRIEQIDFLHRTSKNGEWDTGTVLLSHFHQKWDKRTVPVSHSPRVSGYLTVIFTLDLRPVAGSLTVRVITPGVLPAWQRTTSWPWKRLIWGWVKGSSEVASPLQAAL